ncbi:hypothetical protein GWN42_06425 [candidate division KSB1 bacterium]|nr:hypothetical protein [candidate division KSB1 bacterium]
MFLERYRGLGETGDQPSCRYRLRYPAVTLMLWACHVCTFQQLNQPNRLGTCSVCQVVWEERGCKASPYPDYNFRE